MTRVEQMISDGVTWPEAFLVVGLGACVVAVFWILAKD